VLDDDEDDDNDDGDDSDDVGDDDDAYDSDDSESNEASVDGGFNMLLPARRASVSSPRDSRITSIVSCCIQPTMEHGSPRVQVS